jgi:hypothetical protein
MTLRDYAEQIHENEQTVLQWKREAEVAVVLEHDFAQTPWLRRRLIG